MAYAIPMIEPLSRKRMVAYTGVSWTCLFFGPFPALYRGHVLGFIGMSLVNLATLGFSAPVFIFVYNAWHYHSLLARGFVPASQAHGAIAQEMMEQRAQSKYDLDEIFDEARPNHSQNYMNVVSPELSDGLIDDHGRGAHWKK